MLPAIAVWASYATVSAPISDRLAEKYGRKIESVSKGVITAPRQFIRLRLQDLAWGTTLISCIALLGIGVQQVSRRVLPAMTRWIPLALFLFISANLILLAASESATFWALLYFAHPNPKQASYHLRSTLLAESTARTRVVIVGSSQERSEIDGGQLNRRFFPEAQFANLGYDGSTAFDLTLLQENYLPLAPEYVIIYLSEMSIYTPIRPGRIIPLITPRGLAELSADRPSAITHTDLAAGALSCALPAFRLRRAISLALFGMDSGELREKLKHREIRTVEDIVQATARTYQLDENAERQKRYLERVLQQNNQAGIRTIVIGGQVNPRLEREFSNELRQDFRRYLSELPTKCGPLVSVIDDLPRHSESEYEDLDMMHVWPRVRTEFTDSLAARLQVLLDRTGDH